MSPNSNTPELSVACALPLSGSENVSSSNPIVWPIDPKPLESPPKRKRGRPPGSKNKPKVPGEKRTARALYDIQKRNDAEIRFQQFLRNDAHKCLRGENKGSKQTLSVIYGSLHRFAGASRVTPDKLVEYLLNWNSTLDDPWDTTANCSPWDSWHKKFVTATLSAFSSCVMGKHYSLEKRHQSIGMNRESQMFRAVSCIETLHYLRVRDSVSFSWVRHVADRERVKDPNRLDVFDRIRRECVINVFDLASYLQSILLVHFSEPYAKIQANSTRAAILAGRLADLTPSNQTLSLSTHNIPDTGTSVGLNSIFPDRSENILFKPIACPTESSNGRVEDESESTARVTVNERSNRDQSLTTTVKVVAPVPPITPLEKTDRSFGQTQSNQSKCQEVIDGYSDVNYVQAVCNQPLVDFLSAPTSMFDRGRWNRFRMDFVPLKSVRKNGWYDSLHPASCCFPMASVVLKTMRDWSKDTKAVRAAIETEETYFEGDRARNYELAVADMRSDWRDIYDLENKIRNLRQESHRAMFSNPVQYQELINQLDRELAKLAKMQEAIKIKIGKSRKIAEQLPGMLKRRMESFTPSCFVYPRQYYVRRGQHVSLDWVRYLNQEQACWNGLVHVDLDLRSTDEAIAAKHRLADSGLFSMVAISIRGRGVYGMSRFDRAHYGWNETGFNSALSVLWKSLKQLGYCKEFGLDTSCSDMTRRRFGSFDPDVFVDWSGDCRLPNVSTN